MDAGNSTPLSWHACYSLWYEPNLLLSKSNHWSSYPIRLGTKIDLREDRDYANQLQKQNLQPIKREQGQRLCKKIRAFKYVECSALTQKGLKQVSVTHIFSLFLTRINRFILFFENVTHRFSMMLFVVCCHRKRQKHQNRLALSSRQNSKIKSKDGLKFLHLIWNSHLIIFFCCFPFSNSMYINRSNDKMIMCTHMTIKR